MTEFSTIDLSGQVPSGISVESAKHGVAHVSGLVAVYDEQTQIGAWRVRERPWSIIQPIDAVGFNAAILLAIVEAEHLISEQDQRKTSC